MKPKSILSLCGASASRQSNIALAVAIAALFANQAASAADVTWEGNTSDSVNEATNWVGGVLPNNAASVADRWVFGTAGSAGSVLTGARNFGGMLFNANAPAYTIGTTANNVIWQVTSSAITNNSASTQTINYGLAMAQARTFTGTGNIIANGALTGGGNIAKSGTGNLTITGIANTLSNNINVSGNGTLTLGAVGDVGARNVGGASGGNFSITNATLAAAPGVVTSGGNSSIQRLTMNTGSNFTMTDGVFNTFEVSSTANLFNTDGTAPVFTFNLGGASSADVLALTLAPTFTFAGPRIEITAVSPLTIGNSYTVITAPSGLDHANGFVLGTGVAIFGNTAYNLSITNSATTTSIGVVSAGIVKSYYSGAQGSTLNAGTPGVSTNWLDAETGGADTLSQPIAEMHFSATGATNTTIANLGQDFSVVSLNFNDNAGSVTINDAGANQITLGTGGINVAAGSHAVNVPLVLAVAQSFTNSGSGLLTIGGGINTAGSILTVAGDANTNLNGDISGAGGITKNGSGLLTLSGNNSHTGTTNLNAGTLKAGSATALNGTNILSMGSTATLDLNGYNAGFTNISNSTTANTITNTGAADVTLSFTNQTSTNSALLTEGSNKLAITVTNANSGANLFKLDSPNTFSGGITLTGGNTRLRVTGGNIVGTGTPAAIVSSPFGRGPISLGSAAIGATDKGGLMFDALTGTNTVLNEIVFNTELGSDNKGVRVDSTASNFTLAGDLTASLADVTFSGNGDFTISGSIKGPLGLEIGGANNTTRTVTLTAASNPYAGDTTILKGVLSVSSIANQLGTATTPIAMGATGSDVGTARLRYTGTGETTSRGVVTSGALTNTAAIEQAGTGLLKFTGDFSVATANNRNLILDGSTAGTGEISGVISNNSSAFRTQVTKNGSGTWTLSGLNTYSNNTVVNDGTLVLASTGQLTFRTGDTSDTGNNVLSGAGNITLDGSFVIDTSATDASALTSGSWLIENAASLPGAYGSSFTVVGWNDEGNDTWTTTVGTKNYTFDETTGTVTMVDGSGDAYTTWIDSFTPNALLPDEASKLPGADPDGDGITNLMEFVLGGSPVVSSQAILPTQAIVGSNVVLSYKRSDESEAATTQVGQWSTNLSTWNDVTPVLVNENGAAPDDMTVTVPTSNADAGKLFLRLKVVK